MKSISQLHLYAIIILIGIFASCKKNKDTATNPPPSDSLTRVAQVRDSVLVISKDFYLWYNQIPSTFSPQSYVDPNSEMIGIRSYSMEPGFPNPVDKWSFGVLKTDWNQLSGGIGTANSN